jgi:hypothetical protein
MNVRKKSCDLFYMGSQDSLVSIVTMLRAGRPGFDFWQGLVLFFATGSGAHPFSYTVVSRAVTSGREAGHSPPSTSRAENTWRYTSTPLILLNGVVLNSTKEYLYPFIFTLFCTLKPRNASMK